MLSVAGWCSHGSFSLVLFVVCRVLRFSTGSFGLNGSRECLSGDDCTQSRVYEYMSSNGPCQRLKLLPLRTCFTWERRCLRTEVASRTTIWLNFCDITDSFSISVRLSTVGMNNVTITSAHVVSSQSTSFIDTITSFLTKNHCRL